MTVTERSRTRKKLYFRPTMDPSFFADGPPVAFNPEEYRTLSTLPIKPGMWSKDTDMYPIYLCNHIITVYIFYES